MIPQNVTSRYARNLLTKGRNSDFVIVTLTRQYHAVEGLTIGHYYSVDIGGGNYPTKEAVGVTPEQAVERCLRKHGVTFR